ncbi:hypothetical protein [Halobacterium hubeiense]|uniref:hypothetical protein n=1 Tax=Halobacterium hubeiense TaxID=1407499 RepID=UPI00117A45E5|nr:hypothetical protein [Halobacterium hubeiense]
MTLRKRARTVTGALAVITLLVLLAADTLDPGVTLVLEDKLLLVSLISALLGVDLALHQLPSLGGGKGDD